MERNLQSDQSQIEKAQSYFHIFVMLINYLSINLFFLKIYAKEDAITLSQKHIIRQVQEESVFIIFSSFHMLWLYKN